MSALELWCIAVGLSMDAFAVSVCIGLSFKRATVAKATVVGLYFGVFQAVMPLLGYVIAGQFAQQIMAYDHWVSFVLLTVIGGRMIQESRAGKGDQVVQDSPLTPRRMLPLAVGTSIDALAVGVSFAFLQMDIVPSVTVIGLTTLVISMVGVKLGNLFGNRYQSKAERLGGCILIFIGIKILVTHLPIL